jgi:hypothetical protein
MTNLGSILKTSSVFDQKVKARPLSLIVKEIRADWKNVNYAAKPYLDAMETLGSIKENYFCDSGVSVVLYFLCNAQTWKGEVARRVKKELNAMAKRAR